MCIAFVTTKEQGLPTDETLVHIYKSNPDGAGYVSVFTTPDNEKKMRMEKGIMTYDEFHTKLISAYNDMHNDDDYIVAHTRIATSGGVSKEKTHPFMMGDGSFLFHNGIAGGVTAFLHDKESDTEWLAKHCNTLEDVVAYDTTSRYIIIKPDGTYDITNNWVVDKEGRLWTNDGYEPYRSYLGRYGSYGSYGGFGSYYGGRGWYDDYDDDYYKSKTASTKPTIALPSILDTTLEDIANANKDSTACKDGSCTIFTPYTRRDFARYELLKGLSRAKTLRRIEHTLKHNDLEYDREANAWFSGMNKVDLQIKGGNVVIRDIVKTPIDTDITDTLKNIVKSLLHDITSDIGVDPDSLYTILDVRFDEHYTTINVQYRVNNLDTTQVLDMAYSRWTDLDKVAKIIYDDIYYHNFA